MLEQDISDKQEQMATPYQLCDLLCDLGKNYLTPLCLSLLI